MRSARLFLYVMMWSLFSCGKESPRQTIPFAPVYFVVDLNGPDHELRNPLAFKVFSEKDRRYPGDRMGYGGLLVVAGIDGKIYAYDCSCPHEASREIKVQPDETGKAACPQCGSVFVTHFGMGNSIEGPSVNPLQVYRVNPLQEGTFLIVPKDPSEY